MLNNNFYNKFRLLLRYVLKNTSRFCRWFIFLVVRFILLPLGLLKCTVRVVPGYLLLKNKIRHKCPHFFDFVNSNLVVTKCWVHHIQIVFVDFRLRKITPRTCIKPLENEERIKRFVTLLEFELARKKDENCN